MQLISHVCAEFRDKTGLILFSIGPTNLHNPLVAPEAIRQDPLFALLVAEGSLRVYESREDLKEAEKDPTKDIDATGKKKTTRTSKTDKSATKSTTMDEIPVIAPDALPDSTSDASDPETVQV